MNSFQALLIFMGFIALFFLAIIAVACLGVIAFLRNQDEQVRDEELLEENREG
jgi:hypothetical protein